jgi:hypothetical protein
MEVLAYLFCRDNPRRIHFIKEIAKEYIDYKKTEDIRGFYALFKGCPVRVLDRIIKSLHQNEEWDELIGKLKPKKVGVVSRNNGRIISGYLERISCSDFKTELVVANYPEIRNSIYTGEVEIVIDNHNLAKFVGKKEYICGEDEKRVLEKSRINCKKLKGNLYICEKKRLF